jgi:hypothetical protein
MYFKDYSEPYVELQDAGIEIVLQDVNSNEIEDKIIIWEADFDYILSKIPLNEDGEYVALAYHKNVDMPWYEMEPNYWAMDCLNKSLEQLNDVEVMIEDNVVRDICKDICRIVEKAIVNGKSVLVRRN